MAQYCRERWQIGRAAINPIVYCISFTVAQYGGQRSQIRSVASNHKVDYIRYVLLWHNMAERDIKKGRFASNPKVDYIILVFCSTIWQTEILDIKCCRQSYSSFTVAQYGGQRS